MSARSLEFVIPGDLQAATGGYAYDRRMIAGLGALGWRVTVHRLDASFPQPSLAALEHARRVFASLPDQALVLVDGLAGGAMPEVIHTHACRLRLLALVHHPLAAESGLGADLVRHLQQSERRTLQAMCRVIVTSDATKAALQAYCVDPQKVSVVEPGTDSAPAARPPRGESLQMLCVATLIPRKGHALLLEALAPLASSPWHLTCVGSLTRAPTTVQRLREQRSQLGLDRRVTLTGEIDSTTLARLYSQADLFVLPTLLEGYGMAVAEALAYAVPVISTQVGAIAQLVGTDAGLLVPPADTQMLREALARVLSEPALLDRLTAGAAVAGRTLPGWRHACERMSQALEGATAPAG